MSCLLNGVMGVSSCPRPGSAIHKDQFSPAVKTTTPSQQNNYDKEWQDALAEGEKDPRLRNFKKREAVVWESGTSLTTQVDGDRKRRRRFVDGRDLQEEGLTGADTSPIPDFPTTPVVGANAYGVTSTPRTSGLPMSLSDNEDTTSKDDASSWTTHRTSSLPGYQDIPDGQGFQVDSFRHAITDIYITDVDTGLVFINASVFACHSHLVKSPVFWDAELTPDTRNGLHGRDALEEMISAIMSISSTLTSSSGSLKDMELCYHFGISACPDNYSNQLVAERCQDTVAFLLYEGIIYKNPFCYVCDYTAIRSITFVPIMFWLRGRAVAKFKVLMKIKPDFQSVTFALLTKGDLPRSIVLPNWGEYECQLNYRGLAEPRNNNKENREGPTLSSTEIEEKEKRSEKDANHNSQLSLLESDVTKQNLGHCKLLSCRVGKKHDETNSCEADWYINIRLPPVSKPLCPEISNSLDSLIIKHINRFEQKVFSPFSKMSLLGIYEGSYVYQFVFTAQSFFDITVDRSTPSTINYVLSSVLLSAGIPMSNVSFCIFHGLYTNGQIPKHEISSCPNENETAPKTETKSNIIVICSGQERNYFSWVFIVIFSKTIAYVAK